MDLLLLLKTLKPALDNSDKLLAFIKNEMAGVIEKIGDAQFAAAKDALKQAKKSGNEQREINSAITCLRLAYETFQTNANPSWFAAVAANLTASFRGKLPSDVIAAKKACMSAILIAACYKHLKEDALMREYVNKAHKCFNTYARKYEEYMAPSGGLHGGTGGLDSALKSLAPSFDISTERKELTEVKNLF